MAQVMRGSIIMMPKITTVQIPGCKSYQHKPRMIMLQTHDGRMHVRNIGHSKITCAAKKPGTSKGGGGQINETNENVSDLSSQSNTNNVNSGNKSKGDASATTDKSVAANRDGSSI